MRLRAADLFCGAGGTSSGLAAACRESGITLELTAVNHWPVAIETHTANHPAARHLCADLDAINPRDVVPGGTLDLLIASPECTHHSSARGGRPVTDQKRASAWHVVRWCEALYVRRVLVENVPEFRSWGPIGRNGRPMKSKAGQTYQAWLQALRSLGYRVEDRVLNAADYGDPTTRRRLFVIAQRGSGPIRWPEPTHARKPSLFPLRRWRPARDVIDWSIKGQSIFERKRPLAAATMRRIVAGLERFSGPELKPFLVVLRRNCDARSIDDPAPTITAGAEHVGLCEPFLLQQQSGGVPRPTDEPCPTVAAKGAIALVEPFVLPPLGVHARGGEANPARSLDDPLNTVIASRGAGHLVEPFLVQLTHGGRVHGLDAPLPTVTAANRGETAVVEPFLTRYNGTGGPRSVDQPIPAVTAKDRFGLVQPVIDGHALDIRFRMLQPHELAAAQGFAPGYSFAGNRGDQVRQIGNAVPVGLSTALCRALLAPTATRAEIEEATA